MRWITWLLFGLWAVAQSTAAQNQNTFYESKHGAWRVVCIKDAINDNDRECLVGSVGRGNRSVIGGDDAKIYVWSKDKNANPAINIEVPYQLMLERGLTIRADDHPPINLACTAIERQTCIIKGGDCNRLLNEWRNAKRVVVRGYSFSETGPDYFFDMSGFDDGFRDFLATTKKYL